MTNPIAVIDKEPSILRAAALAAQAESYDLITATTGAEGLLILQTVFPWLVIVGEYLPDMSAREFIRAFRGSVLEDVFPTADETLPFGLILLTARIVQVSEFSGSFSPDLLLTKPFNPAELRQFIRRLREYRLTSVINDSESQNLSIPRRDSPF